jgi:D-serine deaminase-like pyridoxal phosphate-dependent protein
MLLHDIPTPAIVISGPIVRRNLARMAEYARRHRIGLRPHTKTHKSLKLARMQMEHGAVGLTVAKVGEARVMAEVSDDVLMAYPAVDRARCSELAALAKGRTVRVGIDSTTAAEALHDAAREAGTTIGILVDLDVGHHRTGVQTPTEALKLAQHVARLSSLRLDGLMFFPGHLSHSAGNEAALRSIDGLLGEAIEQWKRHGLEAKIVSGGSTPTAYQSHLVTRLTEMRPGTYVYNDVNSLRAGCATLDDCAARIVCTVVSTAVPGQVVLDAGSKTLTSDRCGPAPDSGHGYVVEYPNAKITKLSEEHAQVDATACDRAPKLGDRVTVVPNHICPCVNLQDAVWWFEEGWDGRAERLTVDARGKVF